MRSGLPGTYPTFIAGERWVVKCFGRPFDGELAFRTELQTAGLLRLDPQIPAPPLLAAGCLLDAAAGWPWPFLVYPFVPGQAIGDAWEALDLPERLRLAAETGRLLRRLHSLPLDAEPPMALPACLGRLGAAPPLTASWAPHLEFLEEQRQTCRERNKGLLPPHLLDQLDVFLPAPADLLDPVVSDGAGGAALGHDDAMPLQGGPMAQGAGLGPPHLIHADLTRDHILGRLELPSGAAASLGHGPTRRGTMAPCPQAAPEPGPPAPRWQTLAWIDFGDARVGGLAYELAALHLDLFRLDRRLLHACLDAYGLDPAARQALPRRALAAVLLHQFSRDLLGAVPAALLQAPSLETLAQALFGEL